MEQEFSLGTQTAKISNNTECLNKALLNPHQSVSSTKAEQTARAGRDLWRASLGRVTPHGESPSGDGAVLSWAPAGKLPCKAALDGGLKTAQPSKVSLDRTCQLKFYLNNCVANCIVPRLAMPVSYFRGVITILSSSSVGCLESLRTVKLTTACF